MAGAGVLVISRAGGPWPAEMAGDALLAAACHGGAAAVATRLAQLAPAWYRDGRLDLIDQWCRALPEAQRPSGLRLWQALASWYRAPAEALALLRGLGRERGLDQADHAPAPAPALGDDLYLLAAWWRSELALLSPPAQLEALAHQVDAHLAAPDAATLGLLPRLGGHTVGVVAAALRGDDPVGQARRTRLALDDVARLDDRHSLCSTVALGRWPLLRGCFALARETCELITVGLLAGDDAHMPLAHGWLMALQAALATPGHWDGLQAWRDGSIDRAAVLASPIAPTLLGALATLEAQAPAAHDAGVQAEVLARQDAWAPHERWHALAARAWHHLRQADLPAARAVLRLLHTLPVAPDGLLGTTAALLQAQADALAGTPPGAPGVTRVGAQPPSAATRLAQAAQGAALAESRGWPGPAQLWRWLAWADAAAQGLQAAALPQALQPDAGLAAWQQHGLALPLYAAQPLVRKARPWLARALAPSAAAADWLAALDRTLGEPTTAGGTGGAALAPAAPAVRIGLAGGLHVQVDGQPLAWGRKPPRRLMALCALLALKAPAEFAPVRLADALYPELDGDAALHALDTALYRLRRLLPPGSLRRGSVGVAFDPARVQVARHGPTSDWLPEFDTGWADAARAGQLPA